MTPSIPTDGPSAAEPVRVRLVAGKQLTTDLCARWAEIQQSNPALGSPYFRPEFTQTVAAVRSDVEVAVLENSAGICGFLPFQRDGWSNARPVAGRLSDFQALIVPPGFNCDPKQLLSGMRVCSWQFDHLLCSQSMFQPFMWTTAPSTFVDLTAGYAPYLAARRTASSEVVAAERKLRKMERELGPLRLERQSRDAQALETLLRWKSEQYLRTGLRDLFTFDWIRTFLTRLLEQDSPGLRGLLSCLYAGDRLVAAHLGMSSLHVLHWWFPSYDRELSKYSPGLGLILKMAEASAAHGITRIDFGKGDEEYKVKFATGCDQVAEGSVDLHLSSRLFRRSWQLTRDWVKASPLHGPTQVPLRWIRRMRDWLSYR